MDHMKVFTRLKHWAEINLIPLMEFQQRIWVVCIGQGTAMSDTFVVSEDGFNEPLEWMKRKGYDVVMLARVEALCRSESTIFNINGLKHYLLRVK